MDISSSPPPADGASGTDAQRASGTDAQRASGTDAQRASGTDAQRASGTDAQRASGATTLADRRNGLFSLAREADGFMPDDEGEALYLAALRAGASVDQATFVEIGAWCGKSTVYIGAAAEETGAVLFSLDHHHGSEENQAGWEHHDPTLVDPATGLIDTLPRWRRTIMQAGLEPSVVGVVGDSPTVASRWSTPIHFCFIDGGHGDEPAWADYRGWTPQVANGGWVAIHDVFPDPADGGRPPHDLWRAALDSGEFVEDGECGSLRIVRRVEREG